MEKLQKDSCAECAHSECECPNNTGAGAQAPYFCIACGTDEKDKYCSRCEAFLASPDTGAGAQLPTGTVFLSPAHLALAPFAHKTDTRPVLRNASAEGGKITATDAYMAIEVELAQPVDGAILIDRNVLEEARKKHKSKELPAMIETKVQTVTTLTKENSVVTDNIGEGAQHFESAAKGGYPDATRCYPEELPTAQVKLDAVYLETVAAYMRRHGQNEVTLSLYGHLKPAVFTGKTEEGLAIRGLIMPRRMEEAPALQGCADCEIRRKEQSKGADSSDGLKEVRAEDLPF